MRNWLKEIVREVIGEIDWSFLVKPLLKGLVENTNLRATSKGRKLLVEDE